MVSFFLATKLSIQYINLMDYIILNRILKSYYDDLLKGSINMESRSYQSRFIANNLPTMGPKHSPLV